MDTVTVLRGLWRRRLFVVVVVVLAALAAAGLTFGTKKYSVGVSSTRILVNTPHSQIVDIAPKGTDSLAQQALLLASLMVDGDLKTVIAHHAGLKPGQIVGVGQSVTTPGADSSSTTPTTGPKSYVLTTNVLTDSAGDELPIIELDAQAPTVDEAQKLATAAIAGVHDYLNSVAAVQEIPNSDRLVVTSLGLPEATTQAHGPSTILAILAFIFVFCLGCTIILAVPALARGWRAAAVRERMLEDERFAAYETTVPREPAITPPPAAPVITSSTASPAITPPAASPAPAGAGAAALAADDDWSPALDGFDFSGVGAVREPEATAPAADEDEPSPVATAAQEHHAETHGRRAGSRRWMVRSFGGGAS